MRLKEYSEHGDFRGHPNGPTAKRALADEGCAFYGGPDSSQGEDRYSTLTN
jgi:hypothetical protein